MHISQYINIALYAVHTMQPHHKCNGKFAQSAVFNENFQLDFSFSIHHLFELRRLDFNIKTTKFYLKQTKLNSMFTLN